MREVDIHAVSARCIDMFHMAALNVLVSDSGSARVISASGVVDTYVGRYIR